MENSNFHANENAFSALQSIKYYLQSNKPIIPVHADLYLTKGQPGFSKGHLLRDFEVEENVYSWLENRVGYHRVI